MMTGGHGGVMLEGSTERRYGDGKENNEVYILWMKTKEFISKRHYKAADGIFWSRYRKGNAWRTNFDN